MIAFCCRMLECSYGCALMTSSFLSTSIPPACRHSGRLLCRSLRVCSNSQLLLHRFVFPVLPSVAGSVCIVKPSRMRHASSSYFRTASRVPYLCRAPADNSSSIHCGVGVQVSGSRMITSASCRPVTLRVPLPLMPPRKLVAVLTRTNATRIEGKRYSEPVNHPAERVHGLVGESVAALRQLTEPEQLWNQLVSHLSELLGIISSARLWLRVGFRIVVSHSTSRTMPPTLEARKSALRTRW